jgi:hypothetical protein
MQSILSFITIMQRALSPYIGSLDRLSTTATIANPAAAGMRQWTLIQQLTI